MGYRANHSDDIAVSYASSTSTVRDYSVTTGSWKKNTCCSAFRFGSRCSDCPGGIT